MGPPRHHHKMILYLIAAVTIPLMWLITIHLGQEHRPPWACVPGIDTDTATACGGNVNKVEELKYSKPHSMTPGPPTRSWWMSSPQLSASLKLSLPRTPKDREMTMGTTATPAYVRPLSSETLRTCLQDVVTVGAGGRFGNCFMEWASALGVARRFNRTLSSLPGRTVLLPSRTWKFLTNALDGIEAQPLSLILEHRRTPAGEPCIKVLSETAASSKPTVGWREAFKNPHSFPYDEPIILPRWVVFVEAIVPLVPELHANVTFKPSIHKFAWKRLRQMAEQVAATENTTLEKVVFVGLHARRTDYHQWLKNKLDANPAPISYYTRALRWMLGTIRTEEQDLKGTFSDLTAHASAEASTMSGFRGVSRDMWQQRETKIRTEVTRVEGESHTEETPSMFPKDPPVAVVVVSDDMSWANKTLIPTLKKFIESEKIPAVQLFSGGRGTESSAMQDLAILSLCNHSIISYGTYGATAALLAGGRTVAFDLQRSHSTVLLARYLPNWTHMQ